MVVLRQPGGCSPAQQQQAAGQHKHEPVGLLRLLLPPPLLLLLLLAVRVCSVIKSSCICRGCRWGWW